MSNKYLSTTVADLVPCAIDANRCKAPVSVFTHPLVACTQVAFSAPGIVDGIPLSAINEGKWFTVNALAVGAVDVSFLFNDGTTDVIHVTVTDPNAPVDSMQVTVPKSIKTVVLVIER